MAQFKEDIKWLPVVRSLSQYHASFIRGYHVQKEVWSPDVGESFVCFDEEENVQDRKAVAATYAEGIVVGHLPCEISNVCSHFIKHGGDINRTTTGRLQHTKQHVECPFNKYIAEIRGQYQTVEHAPNSNSTAFPSKITKS